MNTPGVSTTDIENLRQARELENLVHQGRNVANLQMAARRAQFVVKLDQLA
jgi:hypothetical protein